MSIVKGIGIAAGILAGAGAVALAGSAVYFFRFAICRKKEANTPEQAPDTGTSWDQHRPRIREGREWLAAQPSEEVSIRSFDGLLLKGKFYQADQPTKNTILGVHGYRSAGDKDFAAMAPFYHRMGWNVLLVDDRAHGRSEGKYVGFGCLDRWDCQKWTEFLTQYLQEKHGIQQPKIFLHGVSMGAATVLMASGLKLPDSVKGVISDCGFTSPWDIFQHVLKRDYHMPPYPLLPTSGLLCKWLAGYGLKECSALDAMRKTQLPVLFIHGSEDDFVPCQMAHQLYEACGSQKELVIVEGATHAESYYKNTPLYEKAVLSFLDKILTQQSGASVS